MSPDLPPQVVPPGASAAAAVRPAGEAAALPAGELLLGAVEAPPPGSPPGAFQITLAGTSVLLRSELLFLPGERLIVEAGPGAGEGRVRLLARAGEPGGRLEILPPGFIRLAPGSALGGALRALLARTQLPLLGEVLPFRHPSRAPVRIAGQEITLSLDGNTRAGDRLLIRPERSGGALGLRVIARGGPPAEAPPAGFRGLLQVLRLGGPPPAPAADGPALVPGTVLTGTLVRIAPPPGPAVSPPAAPPAEGEAAPPPGGRAPSGGGRIPAPAAAQRPTALVRFPAFDIEVPWPAGESEAFSPGDPVRFLVHRGGAPLDLELLPPAAGPADGGARWIPSGGAGERSFGTQILGLAEGLSASRGEWPPGPLAEAAEGLIEALGRAVVREGELTPERVREVVERLGALPAREEAPAGPAHELREGLERFLAAARARTDDPSLPALVAGAERALTSWQFLQTANGLRHFLEQGVFLQIPYSLSGERGTMDIVVRREPREGREAPERERTSAVFFLDLAGLGPLRIDAVLYRNQASVRFTTPRAEVGEFLDAEIPKLREGIESQRVGVDAISWSLGRIQPEPVVPAGPEPLGPEGTSFIDLKV